MTIVLERPVPTPADASGETTVLIVDDHRCFADLLAASLDAVPGIRCVGTASTAEEGLARVHELTPSVVVMDIQMSGTDGLMATRQLREESPQTAVVVVTAHQDGEWAERAAESGASAFIPKGGPFAELVAMLRQAKPGPMQVAPPAWSVRGAARPTHQSLRGQLAPRELEVLRYLGQGLQARGIAKVMGISVRTCRGYIKTVDAKLHTTSRIEVVNPARQLRVP